MRRAQKASQRSIIKHLLRAAVIDCAWGAGIIYAAEFVLSRHARCDRLVEALPFQTLRKRKTSWSEMPPKKYADERNFQRKSCAGATTLSHACGPGGSSNVQEVHRPHLYFL
eukprot:1449521-Rhodomonas_salina.1